MWRFFALFLLAILGAQMPGAAQASTYDLALTATYGGVGGSGSLMIDTSVPSTGIDLFTTTTGLDSLSFQIGGNTFNLSSDPSAYVVFDNGSLASIVYSAVVGMDTLSLSTAMLGYSYVDSATGSIAGGDISVTPLPATLALFASGLLAIGFLAYRRGGSRNMIERLA